MKDYYSPADDRKIVKMRQEGRTVAFIAEKLNRSFASMRYRVTKLLQYDDMADVGYVQRTRSQEKARRA